LYTSGTLFSPGVIAIVSARENQNLWNLYMTQKNRPTADEEKSALDSRKSAKKPYTKPAFRSEKVFETMALACAKIPHTSGGCRGGRPHSS
jgi:hypothetical protein